jgi:hypothetical protein
VIDFIILYLFLSYWRISGSPCAPLFTVVDYIIHYLAAPPTSQSYINDHIKCLPFSFDYFSHRSNNTVEFAPRSGSEKCVTKFVLFCFFSHFLCFNLRIFLDLRVFVVKTRKTNKQNFLRATTSLLRNDFDDLEKENNVLVENGSILFWSLSFISCSCAATFQYKTIERVYIEHFSFLDVIEPNFQRRYNCHPRHLSFWLIGVLFVFQF